MNARVAIYARVSTTNHGQYVGLQTGDLRQFAEARGWTLADEYVDSGVSGSKDSRPELNRLMADAKRRKFVSCSSGSWTALGVLCAIS
jgi:site-specific DNA recombinase